MLTQKTLNKFSYFRILEESLKLMISEFEEMEYYWMNKLESERKFYENHITESEKKFDELQVHINCFETKYPNINTKVKDTLDTKDKQQINLLTIDEVNNMEKKVSIHKLVLN